MNKAFRWLCIAALMAGLSACGAGGGDPGTSPFGTNASAGGSGGGDSGQGGSGTDTTPVASDLTLVLSKPTVTNTGSDTVTVTATAVDANRNAVANIPVTIGANSGGIVIPAGTATNEQGQLTATVGIGADKTNRTITVTATSGSLSKAVVFLVTGGQLVGQAVPATPNVNSTGNKIQFVLTDANGIPVPNQSITLNGPGTASARGTTGADGSYEYIYTAPAAAGVASIIASAGGLDSVRVDVNVLDPGGGTVVPDAVGTIQSASLAADPSVVSVNTAATNNFAQVRAQFLGANNSPIANVRVRFDLDGDVNSIGGTFSNGANTVSGLSDASGIATTRYSPGVRSSPTDGVTIRACYGNSDASIANGACPNAVRVKLTVASEPMSVTIGTDNTISNGSSGLTYVKRYVVMVVNASGQALQGVQITPSVDLIRYYKGEWGVPSQLNAGECPGGTGRPNNGLCQAFSAATQLPADDDDGSTAGCLNEDLNRNGRLETTGAPTTSGSEDLNGNNKIEPRKADVSIRAVGSSVTDASGIVVLQLEYPENIATWVKFRITASASGVSGTEGRDDFIGILPALTSDFTNPAFQVSPYGTASQCTDPT